MTEVSWWLWAPALSAADTTPLRTLAAKLAAIEHSLGEVLHARRPLSDLPVVVVSHVLPDDAGNRFSPALKSAQRDLLTISTSARQVAATHSGHNTPIEQPDAVADAVRFVVAATEDRVTQRADRR